MGWFIERKRKREVVLLKEKRCSGKTGSVLQWRVRASSSSCSSPSPSSSSTSSPSSTPLITLHSSSLPRKKTFQIDCSIIENFRPWAERKCHLILRAEERDSWLSFLNAFLILLILVIFTSRSRPGSRANELVTNDRRTSDNLRMQTNKGDNKWIPTNKEDK